ncbi:MAG TPA: flavin reductase family protein [Terracidiphilus sp.]|jgi:flavin reductase (DIM6/NTAB) family NADH-FMN oxidoreductase RutF
MNFNLEVDPNHQAYKLLVGLVAPRPIALITSLDEDGRLNAAPFSAYNYLCIDPPILGVGVANRTDQEYLPKDTARNIRSTGEFVVNVVTDDIAEKMNLCAIDFPREISEVEVAGFTTAPSQVVKPPRLAEAHAAMECREYATIEIGHSSIILGRVISIYVEDQYVEPAGPYIKAEELHAIGRMNGQGNYVRTRDAFITIPRITYKEWENEKQ